MGLDEDLLAQVMRFLAVSNVAKDEVIEPALPPPNQPVEGMRLSVAESPDQLGVRHLSSGAKNRGFLKSSACVTTRLTEKFCGAVKGFVFFSK